MFIFNMKNILSTLGWEFKITYKSKLIYSKNYLKMIQNEVHKNIFKYKSDYYENKLKKILIKNTECKIEYLENVTKYFKRISILKKDKLTGLATRQDLEEYLSNLEKPKVFVMCDIDNFKNVNDSYGHQIGDQVLNMLGTIIKDNIRTNDFAGRYGGEEFLIIFDTNNAKTVKKRVDKINKIFNIESKNLNLSFSAGISILENDKKVNEIIEEADIALYYVKKNGKNNSEIYTDQMKSEFLNENNIV